MSAQSLPVAEPGEVRGAAWRLIRSDRTAFVVVLLTNCAAAGAGLVGPWLLGKIVNEVQAGAGVATIDRWGLLVVLAAAAQLLIGHQARRLGYRFGERTAARLREQLADRLMRIPARAAEGAGTGDLTSRATADAGLVSFALRDAAPEMVFALAQALIIIVAVVVLSPVLGVVGLVAAGALTAAGTLVPTAAVAGVLLFGLTARPVYPLLVLTTRERTTPDGIERLVALQSAASSVGAASLPALVGLAMTASPATYAVVLPAAAVVAALLLLALRVMRRQRG